MWIVEIKKVEKRERREDKEHDLKSILANDCYPKTKHSYKVCIELRNMTLSR